MNNWYEEYWSQTWYKNTFLVSKPNQIAQVKNGEWNNIAESGCHFTCLAMIVGIDPARLASELGSQKYFLPDKSLEAKRLSGKTGGLVWDQNAPHDELKSVVLKGIWHSRLRKKTSIKVRFVKKTSTKNYIDGKNLVTEFHEKGHHVICGTEEHSLLVAGTTGEDFFVWDPDSEDSKIPVKIYEGKFTMLNIFKRYKDKPIEFWSYQVDMI